MLHDATKDTTKGRKKMLNKKIAIVCEFPEDQLAYKRRLEKLSHNVVLVKKGSLGEIAICQTCDMVLEDEGRLGMSPYSSKAYIERREQDAKSLNDYAKQSGNSQVPSNDAAAIRARHNRNKLRL